MSSIEYIKSTLKRLDNDNLLNFLLDIVTCGGIDTVEDYNTTKQYKKDEKVYFQDEDGMHHIFICIVDKPAIGTIYKDEWLDLLQYFRRPIVDASEVVSNFEMIEEVIISTKANQTTFTLTSPGVENKIYTVIVYHPTHGRLAKEDFTLVGRNIKLNSEYAVTTLGDKLIVDLVKEN